MPLLTFTYTGSDARHIQPDFNRACVLRFASVRGAGELRSISFYWNSKPRCLHVPQRIAEYIQLYR
jgi:hypothetical protein